MKEKLLAFFASGAWIGLSEFIRNELLFKSLWIEKYESLGLVFPSEMINNALWGVWSFVFAFLIVFLTPRLKFLETIIAAWVPAFIMMWLVVGNMNVLPIKLLIAALPLSIVETALAAFITYKILGKEISIKA